MARWALSLRATNCVNAVRGVFGLVTFVADISGAVFRLL